jgi:tetratricopeptide (TPR) repeat protein
VLRDFPLALKSYQEALRRLPNSAFVLEQMAHLERRLGQPTVALTHYQTAAQLDPRNLGVLLTEADTLGSLRRFDEARAVIDRVLEIAPGNESALASKAAAFQLDGRIKEAAETLAKIPADSKDESVSIFRMLQFFYERNFNAAIAEDHKAPPTTANDPRMLTFVGYCQKYLGRESEARATFSRVISAIKSTPNSVVPVDAREFPSYLAWAYQGLGQKDKALEQARRAVTEYENDALVKPFAETVLAMVQADNGDFDSAIAALPHLLEMPNGETLGTLRVNPLWDPLRKDPRFQKIVTSDK